MTTHEFHDIRAHLKKTQREMAALLGISLKAVESYEQGWRRIPANIERIAYFLLFKLHMNRFGKNDLCWVRKKCPPETRRNCIAWVAVEGLFCWFLTGKTCIREKKIKGNDVAGCLTCDFFAANLRRTGFKRRA